RALRPEKSGGGGGVSGIPTAHFGSITLGLPFLAPRVVGASPAVLLAHEAATPLPAAEATLPIRFLASHDPTPSRPLGSAVRASRWLFLCLSVSSRSGVRTRAC